MFQDRIELAKGKGKKKKVIEKNSSPKPSAPNTIYTDWFKKFHKQGK